MTTYAAYHVLWGGVDPTGLWELTGNTREINHRTYTETRWVFEGAKQLTINGSCWIVYYEREEIRTLQDYQVQHEYIDRNAFDIIGEESRIVAGWFGVPSGAIITTDKYVNDGEKPRAKRLGKVAGRVKPLAFASVLLASGGTILDTTFGGTGATKWDWGYLLGDMVVTRRLIDWAPTGTLRRSRQYDPVKLYNRPCDIYDDAFFTPEAEQRARNSGQYDEWRQVRDDLEDTLWRLARDLGNDPWFDRNADMPPVGKDTCAGGR